jgi:TRAP-type mannitol/chloroaromatic compound transport system permease small subunit
MSTKRKAWVNILGTIFMLVPFALFIAYTSYDFVLDAYITNEISEDPGGLTHRWMIKAMIPLAFVLLLISAIAYIRQNISKLKAK